MLTVADLLTRFDVTLKLLTGKNNLDRRILRPGITRLDFELTGAFLDRPVKNIAILGNREYHYLQKLPPAVRKERIQMILAASPPLIILTKSFKKHALLLEQNTTTQVPIAATQMYSSDIYISFGTYLSEALAKYETVHGVLLEVYGEGVLITGESGIGKSEVAMEMVKKNHLFVADDAVDIACFGGAVIGRANAVAKNFIEVRGLGVLNIARMFGIGCTKPSTKINLVVHLVGVNSAQMHGFERLGDTKRTTVVAGTKVPYYEIPISPGRKTSDLVESAVIDAKLRREGYNSGAEFIKQHSAFLKQRRRSSSKKSQQDA